MDEQKDPKILIIYAWLHRHGWNSNHGCFASLATLAGEAGVSRKTTQRALAILVRDGWVTVENRPGKTAVYRIRSEKARSKTTQVKNDPGRKRPRGQVENDLGTQVENDLRTKTHKQEPINNKKPLKLQTEFEAVCSKPVGDSKKRQRTKGSEAFEGFWKLYLSAPVRAASQSKPKALAQWQKITRFEPERVLMEALETEIKHQQAAGDAFVIPLPDCFRWLRDERYAVVNERPAGSSGFNHETYVF